MLTRQTIDRFGNRILEIYISEANRAVSFELLMVIESEAYGSHNPAAAFDDPVHLLQQTALTAPDATIKAVAQQLQREATTPHNLVERINDWVYTTMRYQRGATTVDTTAAQAVALGKGMCQDYAHVMLSLCRAAQLPARYISGHLLGEGGSHAWVEVFLPAQSGFERLAFDPTNHRRPHLGYVTVAVGRDYHDVSPTSGTFTAPYGGQLTCSKRAGATLIEFSNGETLQSHPLHS
jgi:transglutaminase-like putative cysteine protease